MERVLDRHLALVGFMGAGKTTLGAEVAKRIGRPFHDVDAALEDALGETIAEQFDRRGEEAFRRFEEEETVRALEVHAPCVLALGGGAVTSEAVRAVLRRRAVTVLLDVDADTAWERARGAGRPLARDESRFRALYEERRPLYRDVADAVARDADDAVLAAGAVHVKTGALERLGTLVPGDRPVSLVTDEHVAGIHGPDAQLALGGRLFSTHELPAGEEAKTLTAAEGLWRELPPGREDAVVALGGGRVTDVTGFVAATHLRGIPWTAVPTTLVGQVDAAIGGKTGLDLPHGKNLVGAFHWPVATVIDPGLLATLPEPERRAGMAEVMKTGLLAGEPLWELREEELVRRCAAYKTGVCLRDPEERGGRAVLNLGHTFAHALETASGYAVRHGDAVALGLLAALRLSGLPTDDVERVLEPRPVRADRARAREALRRDKKGGRVVLLEAPGRPVVRDDVPIEAVHTELDALIAG
ncbi:MAG: bifunctional shikimate kinase/3-dehydroquinate synthase [Gaiellaceae bacterium]